MKNLGNIDSMYINTYIREISRNSYNNYEQILKILRNFQEYFKETWKIKEIFWENCEKTSVKLVKILEHVKKILIIWSGIIFFLRRH